MFTAMASAKSSLSWRIARVLHRLFERIRVTFVQKARRPSLLDDNFRPLRLQSLEVGIPIVDYADVADRAQVEALGSSL